VEPIVLHRQVEAVREVEGELMLLDHRRQVVAVQMVKDYQSEVVVEEEGVDCLRRLEEVDPWEADLSCLHCC
jgi:hypothetical protein